MMTIISDDVVHDLETSSPKTQTSLNAPLWANCDQMDYQTLFRMPTAMKITGRTSTITNAFVNSIIPVIHPTDDEIKQSLTILGMSDGNLYCSYCGAASTEWDHLRPLVVDKKPTGFISEIRNLVPACGKCNQSKGNKKWREWMFGDAKLSPKSKGIEDLAVREKRLVEYEEWGDPIRVDFESIVGVERWAKHWHNWEAILNAMESAQNHAEEIRRSVTLSHGGQTNGD